MNPASQVYHTQCYYDRLHHLMRLEEWLELIQKPDHFQHGLLKQSRAILERGCEHYGYNSVDTEDAEYVAELDAFAARTGREDLRAYLVKNGWQKARSEAA